MFHQFFLFQGFLTKWGAILIFLQVGKLTSSTAGKRASEPFGLGYIKRRGAATGDTVIVGGGVVGTVVEVPFLARQHALSKISTS